MPNAIGNFFVRSLVNSPLHPVLGSGLAVITVHGRKTGRHIVTPVNVVADGDGFTATSLRSRSWWRNLRGGAQAELRLAGQQHLVRGEVVEGHAAVVAGFARYFDQHPGFARYFGLQLGPDDRPAWESLERLADERVIIHLCPLVEA